ncbi:MAG TPA: hypothetical protein VMW27_30500 [Thermoanaerobaculia bacterium]|nr:hypothetical protein [Thermoanaerobaculia bacterium]
MRSLSRLALAAFALSLAVSVPFVLGKSARRVLTAVRHAGEDASAARVRSFGAPYVDAVEAIRRTIPPDGVYALIDGEREIEGSQLWVRHDLAPRKAVFLGKLHEQRNPQRIRNRLPGRARWVVIAYADRPPELLGRSRFLGDLERRRHGR